VAPILGPIVTAFPVQIPAGFAPSDVDGDGADLNAAGKLCPGYGAPDYRPRWGGGFDAPRGPRKLKHRAIDIMAAEGALVVPPAPCEVVRVDLTEKGGNCLYLRDEHGWIWYFGHLRDRPFVDPGAIVDPASTVLGYVGRTGNAVRVYRGPKGEVRRGCAHLHASLTRPEGMISAVLRRLRGPDGELVAFSGEKVDPVPWLKPAYDAGGWRR
jgi:murein DD-endopeptidase MepM/ murein hydrolase activator NlpD